MRQLRRPARKGGRGLARKGGRGREVGLYHF